MGKKGKKGKKNLADTHVFSDEVMDEMQNLEATAEVTGLDDLPLDDDATAVTGEPRRPELTGTDNS